MKTIFLSSYHSQGEKQRSGARALANHNNDPAGGATPVALPVPATHDRIVVATEQPHRPWLFPGMRNAL
jgi:hypothetical protein